MDIKKIFELYTGLYAVQMSTFSNSFAHTNYRITSNLAEDYIMNVPHPNADIKELFDQEYKVLILLAEKKFDTTTMFFDKDSGIRIYKLFGDIPSQSELVDNYISFIKSLKQLHSLNYKNSNIIEKSPIELYHYIRKKVETIDFDKLIEDKILEEAQKIYDECEEKTLCHNNLSLHNIIKDDNRFFFVSPQLVSISDPLYDLANFFFKTKINNKPVVEKFLKRYFGNNYQDEYYKKVRIYVNLAKLIYATWNAYLYSITEASYEKQKSDKLFAQLRKLKFED